MELEEFYETHLKTYLNSNLEDRGYGVSKMQRVCEIGYNMSCHTIEYGLKKGVLVRDSEKEWLHRITKQDQTKSG